LANQLVVFVALCEGNLIFDAAGIQAQRVRRRLADPKI
jgi:hypothetical protein